MLSEIWSWGVGRTPSPPDLRCLRSVLTEVIRGPQLRGAETLVDRTSGPAPICAGVHQQFEDCIMHKVVVVESPGKGAVIWQVDSGYCPLSVRMSERASVLYAAVGRYNRRQATEFAASVAVSSIARWA